MFLTYLRIALFVSDFFYWHKKRKYRKYGISLSSGEQDRTADLRVMNPTL